MTSAISLLFASLPIWWVDPYGDIPYLPDDAAPHGGVVTNVLSLAAAKGEIETVSFSVRPERDMTKVDFVPGDLTGPGGAKIPATAADFALVKVWYRAGGRWETSWCGNLGNPTLINDLVLHDDDLIHVVEDKDPAKRTIKVRISYPDGTQYVDMRKHGNNDGRFDHELHPVMDAPKFVPFNLKKDRFQQYWFTWKVPADAKPGVYRGSLEMKEDGKPFQTIPVELEVYPFALPLARTHYDTSQPYISSWMGMPSLAGELSHSKNLAVAERKVRNCYRSFAEHNAHCPNGPGEFAGDSTDDLAVRQLIIMRQEGMACRLLISGSSFDPEWVSAHEGCEPFQTPEENPERYQKACKRYADKLEIQRTVLEKYLGHHRCYFQSADECGTYFNRRSYPFWSLLHKYGFEAWTDSGVAPDISWSVGMNDDPASARHQTAWAWHKGSAKVVTYAGPFTGPSCPDVWRRTKGLRYYYADFDGLHEYCFYYNRWNHWNDFKYHGSYTQFQIAYMTYDGFIATLAWEAVREALDDVRYLSLLKLRAEAALKSKDAKIRALGRRHLVWVDRQDPEAVIDLFAFRREVARRAAELVAVVGEEPPEQLKPAPELPPCTYGTNVPAGADKAKLAAEYAKNNRYDLAIPMWEQVRTDMSLDPAKRFEAAAAEARLQSEILLREDAVKTIDETLKMADLKGAHRAKLLLQRAKTLLTDKVYEEEFTTAQLDAAAKVVEKSLKNSGASEGERSEVVNRLVSAYLAGSEPQRAIDFAEKAMEGVKMNGHNKALLHIKEAQAYWALANRQKDEDDRKRGLEKAAQMYRLGKKDCGCARCYDRNVLKSEGFLAEAREDWKTAQACYGAESKMYSDEEGDLKAGCVARLTKVTKKLAGDERKKDISFDSTDDGSAIDLDD